MLDPLKVFLVTILAMHEAGGPENPQCKETAQMRIRCRARDAARRREEDRKLMVEMTGRIGALFPSCPPEEIASIAEHTAARGSGRVGRTGAGRNPEACALTAAVVAAVRHKHTPYDKLLSHGTERADARLAVADWVEQVLAAWRKTGGNA
jgi:hypothetical protein